MSQVRTRNSRKSWRAAPRQSKGGRGKRGSAPQKVDAGPLRAHGRDAAGPARPRAEDRLVIDLLRNVVAAVLRFFAPRAVVVAENLLLRHQLIVLRRSRPRPRLCRLDRWLIATLATRAHSLLEYAFRSAAPSLLGNRFGVSAADGGRVRDRAPWITDALRWSRDRGNILLAYRNRRALRQSATR